ncbi:transcriptional regulator [Empedobacter stercoris]|uniref:transcriptional regulator n=1 Tax=Empedobacter stercoris TaxID=1628248 RepID=UPI0021AF504A|nr:transcriptional regulator [Empedobacter stercoris]UWX66173.1 transcriptional regulator [Empedobacter stercoris]
MENKMTNIKERILLLAENVEVTKQEFFKKIGITYSNFTGDKKNRPVNSDAIRNILLTYPQTNPYWLILDKGDMLIDSRQQLINNLDGSKSFGSNINGNNGNITISNNDFSSMVEAQKEYLLKEKDLIDSLKECQSQVTTLLEILKKK